MNVRVTYFEVSYHGNVAKVGVNTDGTIVDVEGIGKLWVGEQFGRLINWLRRSYGEAKYRELQDDVGTQIRPQEG